MLLHKRKHGLVKNPRIPTSEIEQRIQDAKKGIIWPRTPKKPKPLPRAKIIRLPRPISEVRKRNLEVWAANMERNALRKQASLEWKEFVEAWKAKWHPVLGGSAYRKKKGRDRTRRLLRIRETRLSGDKALATQLQVILIGPCACYWCGLKLPQGGTVDHIKSLASGGTHTSDNVCAACRPCNTKKQDLPPEAAGFNGTLF